MPWLTDAVAGSLVAAIVSLVGLLITNQSKISEFRQKWIDALREDITSLVACALEIRQVDGTNEDHVNSLLLKIQEVTTRIVLRLNPAEKESQAIVSAMNDLRQTIHSKSTFKQVDAKANALTAVTGILLKKEWTRVKTGEFVYRWTFRALGAAIVILAPILLYQSHRWLLSLIFHGN